MIAPLDEIFGTPIKVRLLRALFARGAPLTGRETARVAGVSSRSAGPDALDALSRLGIVHRTELSGTHLYEVNRQHVLAPALAVLFRAEWESIAALGAEIHDVLERAGALGGVESVVLFGSFARDEARPGSDLDVLVLTGSARASAKAEDALHGATDHLKRRFGARVSPLVLTRSRFRARSRAGDPLMANILSEGRLLMGSPLRVVAA